MSRRKPSTLDSTPKTVDDESFRRAYLMRLISHPLTVWPFVAGVTDLLGLWVFDVKSGPALFAGVALLLASAGVFLTRLFTSSDEVGREVMANLEKKAEQERERSLDELERLLEADGDKRTQAQLQDLRALAKAFKNARASSELSAASSIDILAGVETLFNQSVLSLEKTLQLWYTSRSMNTKEARRPILDQRKAIIKDVACSIEQLGRILAAVQGLGTGGGSAESELARLREELDQNLEVAKKVAERMQSLEREIGVGEL